MECLVFDFTWPDPANDSFVERDGKCIEARVLWIDADTPDEARAIATYGAYGGEVPEDRDGDFEIVGYYVVDDPKDIPDGAVVIPAERIIEKFTVREE